MSAQSVLAIYENNEHARQAVASLLQAGVTEQSISVISDEAQLSNPQSEERPELLEDVSLGAVAGGAVGLLTGAVVITAAGLGPLAIAGALAAMLGGAATGSIAGLLSGYSVTEEQATSYEQLLNSGHVLVLIHGDPLQVAQAETILESTPPHMLHLHGEAPGETS